MNTAIDVIATFNPNGDMKPIYIRLEDDDHKLFTYKIDIKSQKNERYSGIDSTLYVCNTIDQNGEQKEIIIKYYTNAHKWVLIK